MADILPPQNGDIRKPNGQFEVGNPGKPKGARPKSVRIVKDAIGKAFQQQAASGDMTKLEKAIEHQANAAAGGDLNALIALFHYWVGRPRQADVDNDKDLFEKVSDLVKIIKASPDNDFRPGADMEGVCEQVDAEGKGDE